MTGTTIGTVGSARQASVDEHGGVAPLDVPWTLDWSIGADDRWHDPACEPSTRQSLVDAVPVVRTAVRVPGGDAVQHAYAVGGADLAVLDVANESPAPFALAFVVRGAHRLAVDGGTVLVDGRPALTTPRAPSRWVATSDGTTEERLRAGRADGGPFVPRHDRAGRLVAAFVHPVAHRTSLRAALTLADADAGPPRRPLPSPAEAARGWLTHLERGLQAELPDAALTRSLRAARAATLLEAARAPVDPLVVAALEDWGFDAEAAAAWAGLGWRGRRVARRRPAPSARWSDVVADRPGPRLLLAARSLLAHETNHGTVTLLADLPPAWHGHDLAVHGAPTRRGPLSYAVRWHGPRPVLFWDGPAGTRLRAPGLDPTWTTEAAAGDALLPARVA